MALSCSFLDNWTHDIRLLRSNENWNHNKVVAQVKRHTGVQQDEVCCRHESPASIRQLFVKLKVTDCILGIMFELSITADAKSGYADEHLLITIHPALTWHGLRMQHGRSYT